MKWSPAAPMGGERGGEKSAATHGTNIVAGIEITLYMSYLKVCVARQEQLLTPAAPATILTMKAPQIILKLSAAEGLS